eukprot:Gb_30958 [translate_table: standard]
MVPPMSSQGVLPPTLELLHNLGSGGAPTELPKHRLQAIMQLLEGFGLLLTAKGYRGPYATFLKPILKLKPSLLSLWKAGPFLAVFLPTTLTRKADKPSRSKLNPSRSCRIACRPCLAAVSTSKLLRSYWGSTRYWQALLGVESRVPNPTKVVEAFVTSSAKHKYRKKTRKEEWTADSRTSNVPVSRMEKDKDCNKNSVDLDAGGKLGMVDKGRASYVETLADHCSPHVSGRDAVLRACVLTSGIFAGIALTIRQVYSSPCPIRPGEEANVFTLRKIPIDI